jgi:hypothetical protein
MPPSSPQAPLQRQDLDVVKQQLVVLVSVITTVFVLCPEWLQFYRNLCAIPLLAWLTSRAFDFVIKLDKAWDSAPAMVKYFVPIDFPTITPPYEQIRGLTRRRMDIASIKLRRFASELRRVLVALVNWILCQMPRGKCCRFLLKEQLSDIKFQIHLLATHQDLNKRSPSLNQSQTDGY